MVVGQDVSLSITLEVSYARNFELATPSFFWDSESLNQSRIQTKLVTMNDVNATG